ncbi:MAG: hypothetical protein HFACDABA_02775 [Anaerolineales bacterium]|nr:hypothetical protein [Anaerolineales bacterium]
MTQIFGLVLFLIAALLLIVLTLIKRKTPPAFRDIASLTRLQKAAGMAVEEGTRLHVSLGHGSLTGPHGASGLAGLALLRQVSEQASISDRPPLASAGDAALAILSQDTLESAYKAAGAEELYQASNGRLTGLTPFSYAAGAMPLVSAEQISINVLIGDFGPEAALIAEAADRENALVIGAASDPAAQAVLFAAASDPLQGEELFAAPAYVGRDPAQRASLQVQDLLRWFLLLSVLAAAALKLAGLL